MQLVNSDNIQIYNLYLEINQYHLRHIKYHGLHGYIRKGPVCNNYMFYYIPTVHFVFRYKERDINVPYKYIWSCAYTYLHNLIENNGIDSLPDHFLGLALLFGYDDLPSTVAIHFAYSIKIQKDTNCIECLATTSWIGVSTRGETVSDKNKGPGGYLDCDKILAFTFDSSKTGESISPRISFHDNIFVGKIPYKQNSKLVNMINQKNYYPLLTPTLKFVNTSDEESPDCKQLFSFGGKY